ncbi:MAG TPA: lysophospholipid acyltransferase family protein [Anaerolineales bacterium]|nr:lysophospholipid acyltransferase family protein [Anaerolineales bacterium]
MTSSECVEFDPRDQKHYVFHETTLRRFIRWGLEQAFRWIMRLDVRGMENAPRQGALIVASNHNTNWDVIPMQLALPRVIFFMGKAELFSFPLLDGIFRNCGAFPVFRGEHDAWAMRHAREVLDHGQTLGMFPEGHRSRGQGLGPAKTGTARLAIEADCPILPVAITGSDRFFKSFPRRTRVSVTFLPALFPRPAETALELTDRLMFTIASALSEELRGAYAERR